MCIEDYLKMAEVSKMSDKETAHYLVECAWQIERIARAGDFRYMEWRSLMQDCLDCRIMSALLFEDLGMTDEQARALDWAGKSAWKLGARKLKAELKEKAATLYIDNDNPKAAGYALLNAADSLMSKRNSIVYFDRISDLLFRGLSMLGEDMVVEGNSYIEQVIDAYVDLRDQHDALCVICQDSKNLNTA